MSHAYGVKNWSKGPARVCESKDHFKREPWTPKYKLIKSRDIKAAKAKLVADKRAKSKPRKIHPKAKRTHRFSN
jgi:hypothetical protein